MRMLNSFSILASFPPCHDDEALRPLYRDDQRDDCLDDAPHDAPAEDDAGESEQMPLDQVPVLRGGSEVELKQDTV